MKKQKTMRSLLLSLISLMMSLTMLVGSTFAWFTDSVVSKNNIITSGNLDVVLEYKTEWADDWAPVDETTALFNENALYEPGYTEIVYLRVSNAGSLALKYNLNVNVYTEAGSINVYGDEFLLSDYLQVGSYVQDEYSSGFNYADILIPTMFGTREAALANVNSLDKLATTVVVDGRPVLVGEQTAQVVALVLTMPETVGNEANHKTGVAAPTIELGVTLTAGQYTDESDSFGNDYDKDAEFGKVDVLDVPRAKVEALDPTTVNDGNPIKMYDVNTLGQTGEEVTVDVAYKFVAQHTYEEAKALPYGEWIADYVISFDGDIATDSAGLAGYYGNFGITEWIAFTAPVDIAAGDEIYLLRDLLGQGIPYYAICRDVTEFECGAFNLDPANAGKKMNVQLRLTNPDDATDYVVAGEFNYTFK